MLLGYRILKNVKYYECNPTHRVKGTDEYYSIITLHFKQWWRPKKTFKFPCSVTAAITEGYISASPGHDYAELVAQVNKYLQDEIEREKANKKKTITERMDELGLSVISNNSSDEK